MRHNQAKSCARRIQARSSYYRVVLLLSLLMAFGLNLPTSTAGQTDRYGKRTEIPAGYDLFKTVTRGTRFIFRDEFAIPAGFFDKYSQPYSGVVNFRGVPLGSYKEQKTGDVDTIVMRRNAATLSGRQGATVPIELVAMSLESASPIRVRVGKRWQTWNVKLELSPSRKSEGSMTFMRRNEKGGTFNSELVVYGLFTFTREGDGMQKRMDTSDMKMNERSVAMITLRATAVPWTIDCAGSRSGSLCAGTTSTGLRVNIGHSAPRDSHFVIAVPEVSLPF
jgi:hypothetical protein